MAHYVIQDNKCLQEAYNKNEVDNLLDSEHNITAKSYVNKNDFALIEGTVNTPSIGDSDSAKIPLPSGFTSTNCVVVSAMMNHHAFGQDKPDTFETPTSVVTGDSASTYREMTSMTVIISKDNGIVINFRLIKPGGIYRFKVVLMKLQSFG